MKVHSKSRRFLTYRIAMACVLKVSRSALRSQIITTSTLYKAREKLTSPIQILLRSQTSSKVVLESSITAPIHLLCLKAQYLPPSCGWVVMELASTFQCSVRCLLSTSPSRTEDSSNNLVVDGSRNASSTSSK